MISNIAIFHDEKPRIFIWHDPEVYLFRVGNMLVDVADVFPCAAEKGIELSSDLVSAAITMIAERQAVQVI